MVNRQANKQFKISVVMAVYNVAPFLNEAVDSLIDQDIGFENIQLILVDDGSRDGSAVICDQYAKRYPENIIVLHKENGGVASARNAGLKYAVGKYLNFMDSDDRFLPNALGKMFCFFEAHQEQTDIVTLPIMFFDAQKGEHWQNGKFKKGSRVIDLQKEPQNALMFVNAALFSGKLRDSIQFDPTLPCGEDIKVIYTLLADKQTLGVVCGSFYMYRRRSIGEASLIDTAHSKRSWYVEYFENLVDWVMEYYRQMFGEVPCFVRYVFAQEMQWRIRDTARIDELQALQKGVLTQKEYSQYYNRLAEVLRMINDAFLFDLPYVSPKNLFIMLKMKYGGMQKIPKKDVVKLIFLWWPRVIFLGVKCCREHGTVYTAWRVIQKMKKYANSILAHKSKIIAMERKDQ